jgi:hypothetical protein
MLYETGSVMWSTPLMQSSKLRRVDEEGEKEQPIERHVFVVASPPKRHAAINIHPYPDNQHQLTIQRPSHIARRLYSILSYSPETHQDG